VDHQLEEGEEWEGKGRRGRRRKGGEEEGRRGEVSVRWGCFEMEGRRIASIPDPRTGRVRY